MTDWVKKQFDDRDRERIEREEEKDREREAAEARAKTALDLWPKILPVARRFVDEVNREALAHKEPVGPLSLGNLIKPEEICVRKITQPRSHVVLTPDKATGGVLVNHSDGRGWGIRYFDGGVTEDDVEIPAGYMTIEGDRVDIDDEETLMRSLFEPFRIA